MIRPIVLLIVIASAAALRAGTESNVADIERAAALSRRGIDLLDRHRLAEAEASIRESLRLVPQNPGRLYNLACVLAVEGRTVDAMATLRAAADAGFTDFTHMSSDPTLVTVRKLPDYARLVERKEQVVHQAAQLGLRTLKKDLGDDYAYEADEDSKRIFAVAGDQNTLAQLSNDLQVLAAREQAEVFSHSPDEFIRIVLPAAADFRRMIASSAHVGGSYDDSTRTLVAQNAGRFMFHEFTHALHAADQHALGQEHAVWISEGLASLFEAVQISGGSLSWHDNARLAVVQTAARHGRLPGLETLVRFSRADFTSRPDIAYGESALLLRYLQERGQLKPFYDDYTSHYKEDASGLSALQRVSGEKPAALLKEFSEWLAVRPAPP